MPAAARLLAALALAAALAGCAGMAPMAGQIQPGATREQVLTQAGRPTAEVPLPGGGVRLQYSLQPAGRQAWMVDLDAQGRVARVRQVFTAAEFQRIEAGRWTRADVEREFGPPGRVEGYASWNGPVYNYLWADGNEPMFYLVYFDAQGLVRRAHPAMELVNAPNDRD